MRVKTMVISLGAPLYALTIATLAAQATNAGPAAPITSSGPGASDGILEFSHENDAFIYSDRDFTSGLRLSYTTPNYADWSAVPLVPAWYGNFFDGISLLGDSSAVVAGGIYAQQNMYTPNDNTLYHL
jgi:hypothetical protein